MALSPRRADLLAAKVHEHHVRVRYAETDQMGVVHHSSYALYLEDARTALLGDLGVAYASLEREGIGLVVRRLELRFRAPARYGEPIVVRTRLSKIGGASVTFEYELFGPARDDSASRPSRIAEARTELACIDLTSPARSPRLLPEPLRALLEAFL